MPSRERPISGSPSQEQKKELSPREEADVILERIRSEFQRNPASTIARKDFIAVFRYATPDAIQLFDEGVVPKDVLMEAVEQLFTTGPSGREVCQHLSRFLEDIDKPSFFRPRGPIADGSANVRHAYGRMLAERVKTMDAGKFRQVTTRQESEDGSLDATRLAVRHLGRVVEVWDGAFPMEYVRALFAQYQLDQNKELTKVVFGTTDKPIIRDEMPLDELLRLLFSYTPEATFRIVEKQISDDYKTHRIKLTAPIYRVEKMEAEKRLKDVLNQKLAGEGKEVALDEKGEYVVQEKEKEKTEEKKIEKERAPQWEVTEVPADDPERHRYYELPDGKLLGLKKIAGPNPILEIDVDGQVIRTLLIGENVNIWYRSDISRVIIEYHDRADALVDDIIIQRRDDGTWEAHEDEAGTWAKEDFEKEYPEKPLLNRFVALRRGEKPFSVADWQASTAMFEANGRKYLEYINRHGERSISNEQGERIFDKMKDASGNIRSSSRMPVEVNEAGSCAYLNEHDKFFVWDIDGGLIAELPAHRREVWVVGGDPRNTVFDLYRRNAFVKDPVVLQRFIIRKKRVGDVERQEPSSVMEQTLNLLNTVHNPSSEEAVRKAAEYWEKFLAAPTKKRINPEALRRSIIAHPEQFLKNIPAVPDEAPKNLARKIVMRMYPEMFRAEKKGKGFGQRFREWWSAEKMDPQAGLISRFEHDVVGGGIEELKNTEKVLELRAPMTGFLATGLYGSCDKDTGRWTSLDIPLAHAPAASSAHVVTAVIPNAGRIGRTTLPAPLGSTVFRERVKAKVKKDEKPLEMIQMSNGMCEVDVPSNAENVAYSFSIHPEAPLRVVSGAEIDRLQKRVSELSADAAEGLGKSFAKIPHAFLVQLFTEEFKTLNPKEKVIAIEKFVRENGHYDVHTELVRDKKRGQSLEEQWAVCKDRAKELKSGKLFAGVCADYGSLTAALLRKAGFMAGVTVGYGVHGKEVKVQDQHESAFVLWPDEQGRPRAVIVDGTPPSLEAVAEHVALPSIVEREKVSTGEQNEKFEISVKQLEEVKRALQSKDPTELRKLWNGKLEVAVNAILGAVRPGHARAIRALLDGYMYSPLHHMNPSQPGFRDAVVSGLKGVVDYEREHAPVNEPSDHPAGRTAFIAIEDFADRLVKSHAVKTSAEAYRAVRSIVDVAKPILEKDEQRVFEAVTAYLEAKKMFE